VRTKDGPQGPSFLFLGSSRNWAVVGTPWVRTGDGHPLTPGIFRVSPAAHNQRSCNPCRQQEIDRPSLPYCWPKAANAGDLGSSPPPQARPSKTDRPRFSRRSVSPSCKSRDERFSSGSIGGSGRQCLTHQPAASGFSSNRSCSSDGPSMVLPASACRVVI